MSYHYSSGTRQSKLNLSVSKKLQEAVVILQKAAIVAWFFVTKLMKIVKDDDGAASKHGS